MPESKLPSFFIIGSMKSATSTLHNQLAAQSNIFMSSPKEPNFFSDDAMYAQGIDWYQGLFRNALEGAICGESSTHYTKLPDYPKTIDRLKLLISQPRFVYVMRHPIDRLVSHYMHQWSEGVISCDINQAIDRFPELVNYSCYGMQLRPYLKIFGQDAVLPIFFDRLKTDPEASLNLVGQFIGCTEPLQWRYDLPSDNVSKQRIRKFPGYRYLIESGLMTNLRRALVPQVVRESIKGRLRMEQRPQINAQQREKLLKIFNHDLQTLTDWLGFRLSCENFNSTE
ncbi:sulfotransferase family protein [SAR92 clade bacterium H246]